MTDGTYVNALLTLIDALQTGLLQTLHALGLTDSVAGQPAWPFAWRVAGETLVIDRGLARQLGLTMAACVLAAVFVLAAVIARKRQVWPWAFVGTAALTLVIAPWPTLGVVLTDAVPTSFHRSPTRFEAASIERGLALYRTHCIACHGADGRGEGPAAAAQPVWPPTLSAGLLWKRAEGELLWRVLHGMKGRNGEPTMPGFAAALDTADVWALLDGMKALSAGDSALREASWPWPVRAPDVGVNCEGAAPRSLAQWKGQRIRIVAGGAALAPPAEDPRFVTVLLQADAAEPRADCVATTRAAWQAYASVAGVTASALPGTQFIVDRDGWLRALGRPGQRGWSEDNLICRSDATPASASAGTADRNATPIDGLGALIARMDADPVRTARLGLPHSR